MLNDYDRNDDPDRPFGSYRPDGLYFFGPAGPMCVLAFLIYYTYCERTAATQDGERRARVAGKADDALRAARRWRDDGADTYDDRAEHHMRVLLIAGEWSTPQVGYVGRFTRPRKPATSGRKRKAA